MLNNKLGVFIYYLLRNDLSWKLLSRKDRELVLRENIKFNVTRNDYKVPEKYGDGRCAGGENWDSFQLYEDDLRGQKLLGVLERYGPRNILEIGPGPGFYSRMICKYRSVESYTAVDVGGAFLDYLRPRLETLNRQKGLRYTLIKREVTKLELKDRFDLIVLLSTVHHIPNRTDLFFKLNSLLSKNGIIYCFDPSHYLFRISRLIYKCAFQGYLSREFLRNKGNLSTHHMCTLSEYKRIVKKIPGLEIEKVFHVPPKKLRKLEWVLWPRRWFSTEIGIVLSKQSD